MVHIECLVENYSVKEFKEQRSAIQSKCNQKCIDAKRKTHVELK